MLHLPLPIATIFALCIHSNSLQASIIDIELSGHLNSNPLLEYAVRYRIDTNTPADSSDTNTSFWSFNGETGSPFLIEMEGHINNIEFDLSKTDLNSSSATQLLIISNAEPGNGNGDSFWLGGGVAGSGSITGSEFRLRQPNGNSSLIGTSIPASNEELTLSSFLSYEFFYHNSNNQVGSGTIETFHVTIIPGPGALTALSIISLYCTNKRHRTTASPS